MIQFKEAIHLIVNDFNFRIKKTLHLFVKYRLESYICNRLNKDTFFELGELPEWPKGHVC